MCVKYFRNIALFQINISKNKLTQVGLTILFSFIVSTIILIEWCRYIGGNMYCTKKNWETGFQTFVPNSVSFFFLWPHLNVMGRSVLWFTNGASEAETSNSVQWYKNATSLLWLYNIFWMMDNPFRNYLLQIQLIKLNALYLKVMLHLAVYLLPIPNLDPIKAFGELSTRQQT